MTTEPTYVDRTTAILYRELVAAGAAVTLGAVRQALVGLDDRGFMLVQAEPVDSLDGELLYRLVGDPS